MPLSAQGLQGGLTGNTLNPFASDGLPAKHRLLLQLQAARSPQEIAALLSRHTRTLEPRHVSTAVARTAFYVPSDSYTSWASAPPPVKAVAAALAHLLTTRSHELVFSLDEAAVLLSSAADMQYPADHVVTETGLGILSRASAAELETLPADVLAKGFLSLEALGLSRHPLWLGLTATCFGRPSHTKTSTPPIPSVPPTHSHNLRPVSPSLSASHASSQPLVQQPTVPFSHRLNSSQLVAVASAHARCGRPQPPLFDAIAQRLVSEPGTFGLEEVQDALWAAATVRYDRRHPLSTAMLDAAARKVSRYLALLDPASCQRILWSFAKLQHPHAVLHPALAAHVASSVHCYSLGQLCSMARSFADVGMRDLAFMEVVATQAVLQREELHREGLLEVAVASARLGLYSARLFGALASRAVAEHMPR